MSFALTTDQFLDGSKTVTRRLGWLFLKAGDEVMAVEKSQGLGKGGKIKRLGAIRIVSVCRERLDALRGDYGKAEAKREGFPQLSGEQFVEMFCKHMRVTPDTEVTRIQFRKVSP